MNYPILFWEHPNRDIYLKEIKSDFIRHINKLLLLTETSLPVHPELVRSSHLLRQKKKHSLTEIKKRCLFDSSLYFNLTQLIKTKKTNKNKSLSHTSLTSHPESGLLFDLLIQQETKEIINDAHIQMALNEFVDDIHTYSKDIALTMALICKTIQKYSKKQLSLSINKAFLIGLFSNIGALFATNAYKTICINGEYLDISISKHIMAAINHDVSQAILKKHHFDQDFLSINQPKRPQYIKDNVAYYDIKKMAVHLLMFRAKDENIDEHEIELTLAGAEAMYELSNLDEQAYQQASEETISELFALNTLDKNDFISKTFHTLILSVEKLSITQSID